VKFRASLDATEATLADGRPLIPGDEYDLAPEEQHDPFNTRLIAEGQLISISQTDRARADAEGRLSSASSLAPQEPPQTIPDNQGGGS
jgi:hypothetical protein